MAIMAVTRGQQSQQREKEESSVDKIIKGLQIASGVLGIATNYQQLGLYGMQRDKLQREQSMKQELASGKIKPETLSDLVKVDRDNPQARQVEVIGTGEKYWVADPQAISAQLQLDKYRDEKAAVNYAQSKDLKDWTDKTRKEYDADPITKSTKEILQGWTTLVSAAKAPAGVRDVLLSNAFQKIADPGVAVREGDIGLQTFSAGLKEKAKAYAQFLTDKGYLSPEIVNDMLASGWAAVQGNLRYQQNSVDARYKYLAEKYGADPTLIIDPFWAKAGETLAPTFKNDKGTKADKTQGGNIYYPPMNQTSATVDPIDAIIERSRQEATIPANTVIRP